jgi:pyruvate dehydrogenase E2 component (dihydrolipoamide acetyltransferase)
VFEFKLPDLGEGIHEAEILEWHVEIGGSVGLDEVLVDVETDKATVTLPSPVAGILRQRVGEPGETVHVDQIIAVLEPEGSSSGAEVEQQPAPEVTPQAADSQAAGPEVTQQAADSQTAGPEVTQQGAVSETAARVVALSPNPAALAPTPGAGAPPISAASRPDGAPVPAAPATRRLARELGVDLRQIPLTDPKGRITDEDVRAFALGDVSAGEAGAGDGKNEKSAASSIVASGGKESVSLSEPGVSRAEGSSGGGSAASTYSGSSIPYYEPEPLPDFEKFGAVERQPLRSIRRKIAKHMVVSNVTAPRVGHSVEVDVTDLEELRRGQNRVRGEGAAKLTLLAFVTRAVASGLKKWPQLNASLDIETGEVVLKKYINIGLAVAAEKGLIVPVVKGADGRSIREASAEIIRLASAVRDNSVSVEDLQGGTFTITNIGPLGGVPVAPMINYPEVAILGMGAVEEKAVVRAGEIVARSILPLVVMFDHRVADGADAARFMADLKSMLSDPTRFLLEV